MGDGMEYQQQFEARLDRFESKIDSIEKALVALAMVEERQIQQRDTNERIFKAIEAIEKRERTLEINSSRNAWNIGGFAKAAWLIVAAGIGGFASWFARGGN